MQQQTNFFTPTPKHLIQLHGFPNITDIIYVKPLYSVRSLVVYPSLRPDSVAIPLFHSAEGQRYLSPQYYLLFATSGISNNSAFFCFQQITCIFRHYIELVLIIYIISS